MVPVQFRWALGGAALFMMFTAACSTAIPLLLGTLVDQVQQGMHAGVTGKPHDNRFLWPELGAGVSLPGKGGRCRTCPSESLADGNDLVKRPTRTWAVKDGPELGEILLGKLKAVAQKLDEPYLRR
jgi:hypothetical protein